MEEQQSRRSRKPKKSRRSIGHYVVMIGLTLLVLIAGYAVRLYSQTKSAVDKTYDPVSAKAAAKSDISGKKPLSILLLGTDTGDFGRDYKGNSDTMILVTINPKNKRTTMVSIPRDTLAEIVDGDGAGPQKINAAYNAGGNEAAMKTVSKLLNVPINYYVTVNMSGLKKIVDAVGGVDVNIAFTWRDTHVSESTFTKGKAHLDGTRALAYARMRYEDPQGDYGRQKRQREVITQIVKKALSASSLSNYQSVMDSLSSSLRTSLKFADILAIAENYRDCIKNINQTTLKGMGVMINGSSYQVAKTSELQKVSDKVRAEMGLEAKTLDNYDTKQNTYNTNAGFDWSDGNNPVYTLYDEDGSAAATTTYSDDGATITTAGQGMTGPGFGQ
ncbi:MAG: LCP family protein [Lactobacillus sp.]|jgi:LCP family protein required for cell wall assembly|nr:LCP family protein [Lactobacillus sp.]